MTFDRPWVLLLLVLPAVWAVLEWRKTARHPGVILKALAFVAILVALAGPRMSISETKMAVAVLVDTSASVTQSDLDRASNIANGIDRNRGRNWTRIIPFARSTRTAASGEKPRGWALKHTAGEGGRGTDLEAGIREAIAAMPEGLVPRIVLVSDGNENRGTVARAAYQAQQLGIPIDTIALAGRAPSALRLETVSMPSLTFTGERFPIDLVVSSPRESEGTLAVLADGKTIGKTPVRLERGSNRIRAHANLTVSGAVDFTVALDAPGLGELRFDQALTLRRPKVLYISNDPAQTGANLMQALAAAEVDVQRSDNPVTPQLADVQLVIFNNWDLESLPAARKDELENFVKGGGGLLVIGGEKNLYPEGKKVEDALDRTLPAKVAPPRSPEGTVVVLIVDKSSSMEGRKIELARLAAIGVIDNLRPIDQVGVLIFDNSFQWAVPIRRAEDRSLIKRLVAGITPDGGTQIAPALNEAFRRISAANGTFKHIVLLTDGISEEGDSLEVSREAASRRVTISTVGLGQDVNRAYLEKVATLANGKAYLLNDPAGLERILLKDVMEHTGSTTVEKLLEPTVVKQTEILDGVGMETAPTLKGYVRFIAKPTAETILTIDAKKDPLLTRWQYGLGRAAVFASDAKSRWAANWVTWPGYDKFWMNLVRDLLPHAHAGEAAVDLDAADGDLVVDYRLDPGTKDPGVAPAIYAFGPGGFQRPVPVVKLADGAYQGRVPVGQRQGLFRIRPVAESKAFPEVGFYRPEQELNDFGSNEFLLRKIAEFTGGRFNPEPNAVFDPAGRSVPSTMRLWPGLLVLGIALNLAELFVRKWRGLFQRG
jgi:Ca-activated chloride channel family protein